MKVEVVMPRLSDSMSEGAVTAWFKNEGDTVAKGEAIAELETEKSTVDLVAPEAGVLARIVVAAGSSAVAVDTVLAEIETEAAVVTKSAPVEKRATPRAGASPSKRTGRSEERTLSIARPPAEGNEETVAATPLARRMAAQSGLSLAALGRSGIGGKVSKADVEEALGRTATLSVVPNRAPAARTVQSSRPAPATAGVATPMSRVRRTIAERMSHSKATIPHFYLSVDCRVDRLLDVRRRLKDDGVVVSINDFVIRAVAIALSRVPDANATWKDGEGIVHHERIDIAVAVALDEGLVTPVVRDTRNLGLSAIAGQVRDLAARARDGKLAPHEYDGATFTISNLGMHGVGQMFAIVNPPQACILGVGAAEARPVVEDGQVVAGTVMTLSISADHRVLDGTTGAKLLAEIRRMLEEPALMLA